MAVYLKRHVIPPRKEVQYGLDRGECLFYDTEDTGSDKRLSCLPTLHRERSQVLLVLAVNVDVFALIRGLDALERISFCERCTHLCGCDDISDSHAATLPYVLDLLHVYPCEVC